ncbi:MAG: hypothetical protein QE487_01505 [Fluviicola sp.]|nr:hypothetical protein [Fluviicola sp.]
MKRIRIIILLLLTSCLSSCSWNEYFALFNVSGASIQVRYEIDSTYTGFPLFNTSYSAYSTDQNNEIDWNKPLQLVDTDTLKNTVTVILPENASLIIGELSNDHYSRYDQPFINGRMFNLKTIEILHGTQTTSISPKQFDTYFKKKDGIIGYVIR